MRTRILMAALVAVGGSAFAVACGSDNSSGPPAATPEKFSAALNGDKERPTARVTPATAAAEFTFLRDTLRWQVTMTGIQNVTAAHIHAGDANTAGGIIIGLTPGTSGINSTKIEGLVTRAGYAPPGGALAGVTFDSLLVLMRNGNSYVNVHTNNTANDPTNNAGPGDFPAGEIRGQIGPHS
jgi:CHRD domain